MLYYSLIQKPNAHSSNTFFFSTAVRCSGIFFLKFQWNLPLLYRWSSNHMLKLKPSVDSVARKWVQFTASFVVFRCDAFIHYREASLNANARMDSYCFNCGRIWSSGLLLLQTVKLLHKNQVWKRGFIWTRAWTTAKIKKVSWKRHRRGGNLLVQRNQQHWHENSSKLRFTPMLKAVVIRNLQLKCWRSVIINPLSD